MVRLVIWDAIAPIMTSKVMSNSLRLLIVKVYWWDRNIVINSKPISNIV